MQVSSLPLWLQKPLRIAAANPSGVRLADAVARCIDLARPGPVLELGAGTGSLTPGLVRAAVRPSASSRSSASRHSSQYCGGNFQR
jgi:phospholipid N-methyltransferase